MQSPVLNTPEIEEEKNMYDTHTQRRREKVERQKTKQNKNALLVVRNEKNVSRKTE